MLGLAGLCGVWPGCLPQPRWLPNLIRNSTTRRSWLVQLGAQVINLKKRIFSADNPRLGFCPSSLIIANGEDRELLSVITTNWEVTELRAEGSQVSLDGQMDLDLKSCSFSLPLWLPVTYPDHSGAGISSSWLWFPLSLQWGHLDDKPGSSLQKPHTHGMRSHVDFTAYFIGEAKGRRLHAPQHSAWILLLDFSILPKVLFDCFCPWDFSSLTLPFGVF